MQERFLTVRFLLGRDLALGLYRFRGEYNVRVRVFDFLRLGTRRFLRGLYAGLRGFLEGVLDARFGRYGAPQ